MWEPSNEWRLFTTEGKRRYLCRKEGARFLDAADTEDFETATFCRLLAYTGCRLSEASALVAGRLDIDTRSVIFLTLKRRKIVYRSVPVPAALMRDLIRLAERKTESERLWGWSRQTAWRRIKRVMAAAAVDGPQAMPKGLRHRYGVLLAEEGVPLGLAKELLGHASVNSTLIYQGVVGVEKRRMVSRVWRAR